MEAQAAKERERLLAEEKAHARRMAAAGETGKEDQARNQPLACPRQRRWHALTQPIFTVTGKLSNCPIWLEHY